MGSAQEQAFSTPELVENILAHLPIKDLLYAQLISRYFEASITTSPRLQHSLYLRAKPDPAAGQSSSEKPNDWTLNPLLQKHFIPWFVRPGNRWQMASHSALEALPALRDATKREPFLRAEASWRRMLLVQPTPKTLSVVKWVSGRGGDARVETSIPCADFASGGVTMGVVYDVTESFLGGQRVASFGLAVRDEGEGAPRITLYLEYTQQCTLGGCSWEKTVRSKGSEVLDYRLDYEVKERNRDGLKKTWESDLTVERGGVDHEAFRKWLEEMA